MVSIGRVSAYGVYKQCLHMVSIGRVSAYGVYRQSVRIWCL